MKAITLLQRQAALGGRYRGLAHWIGVYGALTPLHPYLPGLHRRQRQARMRLLVLSRHLRQATRPRPAALRHDLLACSSTHSNL